MRNGFMIRSKAGIIHLFFQKTARLWCSDLLKLVENERSVYCSRLRNPYRICFKMFNHCPKMPKCHVMNLHGICIDEYQKTK